MATAATWSPRRESSSAVNSPAYSRLAKTSRYRARPALLWGGGSAGGGAVATAKGPVADSREPGASTRARDPAVTEGTVTTRSSEMVMSDGPPVATHHN